MKLHPLVLALGLVPLVGCGGSGSSSATDTTDITETTVLSGKAADGYLVGAEVCLDTDYDKECGSDDPTTTTGDAGAFTLEGVTQEQIDTYPLLVKIIAGQTIDEDSPDEVLTAYTLSAPAGYTFVSPLTTMVQNEVEKGSTAEEAEQQVQEKLGTEIELDKDYVAAKTDETLSETEQAEFEQLHQVAQVTAKVIADNMALLQEASEEAAIPLDQLITLITDEVFDALAEITAQVEAAAEDPETEFDPTTIASDIDENLIALEPETIEEQVTQNQAENSAVVANLLELLTTDGLNWFWGETDSDGTAELEYGTLKLNDTLVEDQFNEFDFDNGEFVSETSYSTDDPTNSADEEIWLLSENGWVQENELITSITAADNAITLHFAMGEQFNETLTAEKVDLAGLNIAVTLNNNGDSDDTWAKAIAADASFADGDFGYKLSATRNTQYQLESHDWWCDDWTGTYTQEQIKSQLGGICNHIQPPSAAPGEAYIQTLDELKTATLAVDWHALGDGSYNEIRAKLNENGTVTFTEVGDETNTSLAAGTWSEISAYGQTFIKVSAPLSVHSLGDHFADDGTLYFAEYKGFVRQVRAEESSLNELIFDASARDAILANFDASRLVDTSEETASVPDIFTAEYLAGKTFYVVWFGDGDLANAQGQAVDYEGNLITNSDNEIELTDVPVVIEQTFNSDGTLTSIGVKNAISMPAEVPYSYRVDAADNAGHNGILRINEEQDEATEGNYICDNSNPDYLKTHFIVDGAFDNVDLFFFDKQKALDYADELTAPIEPCM